MTANVFNQENFLGALSITAFLVQMDIFVRQKGTKSLPTYVVSAAQKYSLSAMLMWRGPNPVGR